MTSSGEQTLLWYEADHVSVQWEGEVDRVAWLLQQLGLQETGKGGGI